MTSCLRAMDDAMVRVAESAMSSAFTTALPSSTRVENSILYSCSSSSANFITVPHELKSYWLRKACWLEMRSWSPPVEYVFLPEGVQLFSILRLRHWPLLALSLAFVWSHDYH